MKHYTHFKGIALMLCLLTGVWIGWQRFSATLPTHSTNKITLPTGRQDGGGSRNELAISIGRQEPNLPTQATPSGRQGVDKKAHAVFLAKHPYNTRVKRSKQQMRAMGIPKKDRPDYAAELDFIKTLNPATQTVPADGLYKARQAYLSKPKNKAAIAGVNWTERGPNNVGGRTRALMFDPNDATGKKVWAGGVAGGLWFNNDITTNTTVWQKVNDFWANMAVTAIAFDPSNTQTMYVGTGEGFADGHPSFVRGEGIWKTTNAGSTWTQLANTTPVNSAWFRYVNKIAVHSSGMIFAATRSGIIRSTNGGTTWTQIYNTACSDVEIAANGDVYIGTFGGVVARTTNPTDAVQPTWTNFNPSTGGQRVEIAIAPSASSTTATTTLYVIASNGSDIQWFRKSTDGGASWTSVTVPKYMEQSCVFGTTDFTRGQSWYDLILKVRPNNPNVVLVGGIDVYGTTNGGTSWSLLSYWTGGCGMPDVHADQHAIDFRPTNPDQAIFGNDGGVYYSTNAGTAASTGVTFGSRVNGYNVTQFYACAINNTSASNVYLAGAQDNGTQRFTVADMNSTTEVRGGDGGFCFIDQTNPNIAIASYTNNNFYRSTNGGASFPNANALINEETGLFINPADYDHVANTLYLAGDNNQYKFINNIEVSPSVPNTAPLTGFGQVSTINANCFTANRIFIGSTNGELFRVDNANSVNYAVTNIGSALPTGYISSIAVGVSDNELLVTYSSYDVNSVYYTNNGGTTWINKDAIGHGLPNMPIRWGLFNPNDTKQVMLATELGVWSTSDITASNPGWENSNAGLANVRCDMLRYRASDKQVVVATFGRGLYTTNVWASTPTAFTHTALSPANNSTNVALDVVLNMTFSANVLKGTGNIVIKRVSDNSILETMSVTSSAVSVSGTTAFIDPTLNLPASTAVYVEVATGAFINASGSFHAGFSGNSVWQLTTGTIGGGVANFTISPSTINYQPNAVTFTDASTGTITSRSWNFGAGATPATATTVGPHAVTYNTFGVKSVNLTVNGSSVATQNIAYLPTLTPAYGSTDGGGFETDNGHFLATVPIGTMAFERGNSTIVGKDGTGMGANAYVTGLSLANYPNNSETRLFTPNFNFSTSGAYAIGFGAKFSTEANYDGFIVQYSTNFGNTWTNLGTTTGTSWYNSVTLSTTNGFPTGTAIFSGTTSGFEYKTFDCSFLAGNANVAFRFVFKSDNTQAGVGVAIDNFEVIAPFNHTAFLPLNNATNVSPTSNLELTFNSKPFKNTGNILLRRSSDNTILETIAVTSANVTILNNTVTINPTLDLPASTQVYVEVPNTAFLNSVLSSYAGFTGNSTWQFTTGAAGATANFTFPQQIIYQPNPITFADASTGGVTWLWNFGAGASPATSTLQNPPAVIYSTTGVKVITLAINGGASSVTRNIAVLPALPTSYALTDGGDFETVNDHTVSAGNAQDMYFDRGNSTIAGKNGTAGGANAFVTGLNLTLYPNQAQSILYMPNFNFATAGTYSLSFKTKFATELNYDGFIVQYSTNSGLTWTQLDNATTVYNSTVASNVGAGGFVAGTKIFSGTEATFQPKTFDCSFLGGNANVAFRFVFQSDNTIQGAGVAIDDFQITAPFVATTFSPANNATGVNVATDLAITFNSPPQKGTGNIIVRRLSDNLPLETMAVTSSNVTISGNTATINLVNNLPVSTPMYVEITGNTFKNSAGTHYTIGNNTTWRFTTGDNAVPVLLTLSPAHNATNIAVATNLVMTFDENVQKGAGNIVIKRANNTVFETVDVTSPNVTILGATVTINPTNDLESNTGYVIEVANGAIKDLSNNNYAGFVSNNVWAFTTADVVAPTVSTLLPANNAVNVSATADLVMTFSENIQKGTGNIVIKLFSDNSTVETINVASALVTVSGAVATINPNTVLAANTQYYVEVANGAIKDLANNNFAGFTGNSTWRFTTLDNVAPTLLTLLPAHNSTNVAIATNLVMTMSENVQKGTGNIVIKRSSNNTIFETISVSSALVTVSGAVVTVNPTNDLASNTQYFVEVASGAIKDLAGNDYVGFVNAGTWQFTTADVAAPALVSLFPVNGAVNVSLTNNISINFNENITQGTGTITIRRSSDNSIFETISLPSGQVSISTVAAVINPTNNFVANTQYYVEISNTAIADLAGNLYAGFVGNSTWQFTTVDNVAPTLLTLSPTHNATNATNTTNLVMTMSENVQKGAGNITIKRSSNNSIFETISISSATVTVASATVTINPTNDFLAGAQYYVEVEAGAIRDLANNDYAGFAGNTTWQFTTIDNIAPTLISLLPAHNAVNVAVANDLSITLSENVQKGTSGTVSIKRVSDNAVFENISITSAQISVSGAVVTINPANTLAVETQYYVEVSAGAIQDLASNNFAGIIGNSSWRFTTLDNNAPTLVSLNPSNGNTTVSPNANFVMTLSENIQKGAGNITIKRSSDNGVIETINVLATNITVAGTAVTINPSNDLANGVQYYIEVSAGAIQDLSGNNFAGFVGNGTWQFTTSDTTAPTLVSLLPANNAVNILTTANLVMTFSENMQRGSGNISIRRVSNNAIVESIDVTSASLSIAGAVVTINPVADFELGVQYFIDIPNGALKDLANNNFAGFTTNTEWRFTTQAPVDATAPLLVSTAPINNATAFAGAGNLEMTFNENIQKGTNGSIVIRKLSDGTSVETFGISSSRITITGSIVTINPVNDLTFNTEFYVEVSNDYFRDLAGNNFAGLSGNSAWRFKTDFSTAIEDNGLSGFIQLYPNPVTSTATLSVGEGLILKQVQASVIDAKGATVRTEEFATLSETRSMDFSTLPAGKYLLQLRVGKAVVVKPFVKVR